LWFKDAGHESAFYWYITGVIFLSLIVYVVMKDPKNDSELNKD
jgi:MFS transporter, MHS family, alpha-ketoglutarate permease